MWVKTHAMLISIKQKYKALLDQVHNLRVEIKGTKLDTVTSARYVGVNIDSSLDWKEHIKIISSKVSKVIGFLKHGRNFIPQENTLPRYCRATSLLLLFRLGLLGKTQILTNCKSYKINPQYL